MEMPEPIQTNQRTITGADICRVSWPVCFWAERHTQTTQN